MHKMFTGYGILLMLLFAMTMHQGYSLSSLFIGGRHNGPGQNHYHK